MTATALQHPIATDPNIAQRAASNPNESVWVNASAGSGKTKVLTERVTRLLLSGVRPEKILCLTYTRAGAAEMANRVTSILSKWAVCDDHALREDLDKLQDHAPTPRQIIEARRLFARVLSCPCGLRIRTIHSFCQEILSRFPIEAGLPPHFALIDEQEMNVLKDDVLDDLLREAGENPEHELAQALDVLVAAQSEIGITKMLHEIINARGRLSEAAAQARGEKKLIAQIREFLQLEPGDTAEKFRQQCMRNVPEDAMRTMAEWLLAGKIGSLSRKRGRKLADVLEMPVAERATRFDTYISAFLTQKYTPLSTTYVASKEIRALHPEVDALSTHEATRLLSALERIEAADIAQITQSILTFGAAFSKKLAERKAARAALDYDDLILMTENLLQRSGIAPWILYKLDNGIDHVLVDEAQDTSRAQWNIVQALTAEFYAGAGAQENKQRTLFVVGDEKQSIFSFQNADPEAFLSHRDFFAQHLRDAGKNLEKIGLHTSFRSSPAILRAVDLIFAQDVARAGVSSEPVTHAGVSSEPVTHAAFKNPDGSDKAGRVEIWPLLKAAKDEKDKSGAWIVPTGYEDEHDPQAELATQIAQKIKSWLTKGEIVQGMNEPVMPGDIMILLRRRGRFADLMVRALKANKVPVTGVDRMHLIKQLPVMDVLAMLRFVLLPEDDLNLATLLRSPLLGLSEEQLMELAIGRAGTLWQSVKDRTQKCGSSFPLALAMRESSARDSEHMSLLSQKSDDPIFMAVNEYLSTKLNEADFSTPFAFLSHILNAPCPANAVSGRQALWARLGDECLDPIEELLNEALGFSRSHAPSLQNFLHWLTQSDTEIKRELDHGGGQVRIMTVHASKGLEAPIVFLPDTAALPRVTDIPKMQWSDDDRPLFLTRQPDFGAAKNLWQRARDKQMQEYRRLFYVALTRAASHLYICGWLDSKSETAPVESWYMLAKTALEPHHQEHAVLKGEEPQPEIAFADSAVAALPALQSAALKPEKIDLPDWALRPVAKADVAYSLPPSQINSDATATPDAAFARGRLIHRLLQSLPDIAPENHISAIKRFLTQPRHNLTQSQRDEIATEVSALLKDENFSALFAADSIAEAPLTGAINGAPVFRQIDRLCLHGDEIWIVDYKTNRPPPLRAEDISPAYRQQLNEYHILLRGIYPDKKIRCFLLWTYAPRLMEITF